MKKSDKKKLAGALGSIKAKLELLFGHECGNAVTLGPPTEVNFDKMRKVEKNLSKDIDENDIFSLDEIQLLALKVEFTSEIFNTYNFNDAKKMRIIELFDLAPTIREAKLVYLTIISTMEEWTNANNA